MLPDAGPRRHATQHVFIVLGNFLWTLDWKVFQYTHMRVDYWAAIAAKVLTSSRISDYIESGNRRDTDISLKYKCDLHEGEYGGPQPLFMNPILFLLVIFCTSGAFKEYHGVEGLSRLLDLEVPPQPGFRSIQWNPEVANTAVFRGQPQSTERCKERHMMKAGALSRELRELGIRSGCPKPPTLHDFRAESLTKIDMNTRYSETQRQRVAGHGTGKIYQQYYATRNSGVDTQGSYQGKERQIATSEFFRTLEVQWEPALWQTLPLAELEELEREI
ncbi:hypothetical protein PG995_004491 [Apiospora arundinis]